MSNRYRRIELTQFQKSVLGQLHDWPKSILDLISIYGFTFGKWTEFLHNLNRHGLCENKHDGTWRVTKLGATSIGRQLLVYREDRQYPKVEHYDRRVRSWKGK